MWVPLAIQVWVACGYLGHSRGVLGRSWKLLGAFFRPLGPSWAPLGSIVGDLGAPWEGLGGGKGDLFSLTD